MNTFGIKHRLGILATCGLFAIWSIPGTIAFRYLLLLLSLGLLARTATFQDVRRVYRCHRTIWLSLLLLTIWLFIQAALISPETAWALGELKGQWLTALAAGLVGSLLALQAQQNGQVGRRISLTLLMGVLVIETLISIGISVAHLFSAGQLLRNEVPLTGGHLEMSYLLMLLLCAIFTDLLARSSGGGPVLAVRKGTVWLVFMAAVFCLYLANSLNGILVFGATSLFALILLVVTRWRHARRSTVAAVVALFAVASLGFGYLNVATSSRWSRVSESAALGWRVVDTPGWLDVPIPSSHNGQAIDGSAYIRTSYVHAGLRLIGAFPLGVGYGRNAFGHALRQQGTKINGTTHVGHAHNGFIDLGIGAGIPGLALWLAFLTSLIVAGAKCYFPDRNPFGLLLLFVSTSYALRMALDAVNRDHMLQMFFFLVAYLLVFMSPTPQEVSPGLPLPGKAAR